MKPLPRTDKLTQRASVLCLIKAQEEMHKLENRLEKVENSKINYKNLFFELLSDIDDTYFCTVCKCTYYCYQRCPTFICLNCIMDMFPGYIDKNHKQICVYMDRYISIDKVNFVDKKGKIVIVESPTDIEKYMINTASYD